jgi:hypothetical protein
MNGYCRDNAIEWAVPATFKPWYTRYLQAQESLAQTGSSRSASVASQASSSLATASRTSAWSPEHGSTTDPSSVNIPMKCSRSPSLPPPHLAFKRKVDSDDSEIEFVYPPHPVGPKPSRSRLKKKTPRAGSSAAPIILSSDSDDDQAPIKREVKRQKTMRSAKIPVMKLMSVDEVIELTKFPTSFDIPAHVTRAYKITITDDDWKRWQEAYPDKELTMQSLMKHEVIHPSLISARATDNSLGSRFMG